MGRPLNKNTGGRVMRYLWLAEFSILTLAVTFAAKLRFIHDPEVTFFGFLVNSPLRATMVALFVTSAMAALGLYQQFARHQRAELLLRLTISFGFGGIGLLVLFYLIPPTYIGRGVLAISLAIGFAGVFGVRMQVRHLLNTNAFKRRVLVLGAGHNAELINTRLRRASDRYSFVNIGFLAIPGQPRVVRESQILEFNAPLTELVERWRIQEIVVAPDDRRGCLPMQELLACAQRNVAVTELLAFFEQAAGKLKIDVLDPSVLLFSGDFRFGFLQRVAKRAFDIAIALLLLLFLWPVMLLVAALVRIESPGPALYWQTRVGLDGRNFDLVKFRSMRADAEKDGQAKWAQKNDARITRVGNFLRRTRLDELPQLLNILRGEMSFVGPRPERPQFVEGLSGQIRYYGLRHAVKPGLAGWAQLRYPYGASVDDAKEKLKFDLYYVKNNSVLLDAMILLQTVEVVVFGRGR